MSMRNLHHICGLIHDLTTDHVRGNKIVKSLMLGMLGHACWAPTCLFYSKAFSNTNTHLTMRK